MKIEKKICKIKTKKKDWGKEKKKEAREANKTKQENEKIQKRGREKRNEPKKS